MFIFLRTIDNFFKRDLSYREEILGKSLKKNQNWIETSSRQSQPHRTTRHPRPRHQCHPDSTRHQSHLKREELTRFCKASTPTSHESRRKLKRNPKKRGQSCDTSTSESSRHPFTKGKHITRVSLRTAA